MERAIRVILWKNYNGCLIRYQTANRDFRTGGSHMNNTIQYKGYVGSVEFSEEDGIFMVRSWRFAPLFLTRMKVPGNFWTIFTMPSMII